MNTSTSPTEPKEKPAEPAKPTEPNDETAEPVFASLEKAHLPAIATAALCLALVYGGIVLCLAGLDGWSFEKLGQFGDAFGALTSLFNALAFAALIATVILQSRELSLTRKEMNDQAKSQKKLAAATIKQLRLTKEIEEMRLRPFLKAEWGRTEDKIYVEFWIRNVGRGVAIVRSLELRARSTPRQHYGEVLNHHMKAYQNSWLECLKDVARSLDPNHVELLQFNDLNRTLAPDERQPLVRIYHPAHLGDDMLSMLRARFRPTIVFDSIVGKRYSTADQVKVKNVAGWAPEAEQEEA